MVYRKTSRECEKVDPKIPRLGVCPETHNYGRLPAFIKCSINGKTLFKLVYKPRNALIDKAVIETFKKINMLNDEQKSSKTIPLPEYKIVSLDNCSLWEYIDGKDIEKEKSAGVYIYNKFSNRPSKLENAQKVLNRLDAVLTRMQISDLHKENVKIKHLKSSQQIVDIIPIDLENRQRNKPTQLGGNPKKVTLTDAEKNLIDNTFVDQLPNIPFRYLPVSTHIMANFIQNYDMHENLKQSLLKGFLDDKILVKMGPSELEENILVNMLNNDVPYFTEYQGVVYYGLPDKGRVIGSL